MNITGMVHVNINCRDFERSRAFYEALGFRVLVEVPSEASPDVQAAVGLRPYRVRGALMALAGQTGSPLIDLLEWQEPHDPSPPYPRLNHVGIARIALATTDLDADVARLEELGAELLSPPARVTALGPPVRFVCFRDPDGTVLELVETER